MAEQRTLTDAEVADLRHSLANATPGRWKLWGMQVLADQDGTSNVDTAVPVAQTYFRDENGKPRTWDASLIAEAHNLLPALLAERDDLRAALDRVKAKIWALGESIHGDEGVQHNEGCEGEPECLACILEDLRAALRAAVEGGRS